MIFYEPAREGGAKAAIGAAIVREAALDVPTALHRKFASRGVYTAEDVTRHARRSDGKALAIHFELFEPFERPIGLDEIRSILGNRTSIQGLTPVPRDKFEQLRARGVS